MKKTGWFLMVIVLALLPIAGIAEEGFLLHSGVTFGMTMEQVMSKEKEAGFSNIEERPLEEYESLNCRTIHLSNCVSVTGQIAGVKGANICYHFDTKGELDSALYLLGIETTTNESYNPIRNALIEKYGEPISGMGNILYPYLDHMDVYSQSDWYDSNIKIVEVEQNNNDVWLVPQDDNTYVVIVGYNWTAASSSLDATYTFVGYQRFEKEKVDTAIERAQTDVNMVQNQLTDDL